MTTHVWDYAELVLVLDYYFSCPPNTYYKNGEALLELSNTLRKMRVYEDAADNSSYRSVGAIRRKIGNFEAIDESNPSKGLIAASKQDRQVWNMHKDNPGELHKIALSIRAGLNRCCSSDDCDRDELEQYSEGRYCYRMHLARERNKKVVDKKKKEAEKRGLLHCEICGFDFEKVYGVLGKGYIEAHHIKPISSYGNDETTTVDDLALVCSNCHKMLHRRKPWISVEELKTLLADNGS